MDEFLNNWQEHLTSFWVPIVVGLVFLSLAVKAITKDHSIQMFILYVVLTLCCFGYTAFGSSILDRLVD